MQVLPPDFPAAVFVVQHIAPADQFYLPFIYMLVGLWSVAPLWTGMPFNMADSDRSAQPPSVAQV